MRCYLCGHVSEVSHKALSSTCPKCHKAIKIEDLVVKNYLPVNDVQTCGTITITKKGRIAAKRIQAGDGVVCDGAVEGKIETAGPIQMGSHSSWKGSELFGSSLKVDEGATLHGYVAVPCVVAPSSLVETKPLVRHVDPAIVEDHDDATSEIDEEIETPIEEQTPVAEEIRSKPAERQLPAPKIISTRRAAVERAAAAGTTTRSAAPLPTPKPKPTVTRKPAATSEPKPTPPRAAASASKKTASASKAATSTPSKAKTEPVAPKVISTRKSATARKEEKPVAKATKSRAAAKKSKSDIKKPSKARKSSG